MRSMVNMLCWLLLYIMTPSVRTLANCIDDERTESCESSLEPEMCGSLNLLQTELKHLQQSSRDDPENSFFPSGDFLIVSSPAKQKVFWTRLFKQTSADGRKNILLEGLNQPKGLAFDHKHGFLYVADSGAEKIFRSTLLITNEGSSPALQTTGVRIVVAENCGPVEWVTLDSAGNLFYSSPKSNNINKIPFEVMSKLSTGEIQADQLQIVSQKTMQSGQTSQDNAEKKTGSLMAITADNDTLPVDAPPPVPHILSIYEAKLNNHVAKPAGIAADGEDLFWTNMEDGKNAGTVVKGQVNPKVVDYKSETNAPFPADSLWTQSKTGLGLAKAGKYLFFVRKDDTLPDKFIISSVDLNTTSGDAKGEYEHVDSQKSLSKPRALTYDGDASIYVADETEGAVYSFPADRFMASVPLKKVVDVEGAYGLAILNSEDDCFAKNNVQRDAGFKGGQTPDSGDEEKSDEQDASKSEEAVLLQESEETRSSLRRQQVHGWMLASIVAGV